MSSEHHFAVGDKVFFEHPQESWIYGMVKDVKTKEKRLHAGMDYEYTCVADVEQAPGTPKLQGCMEPIARLKEEQVHTIVAVGGQEGQDDVDDLLELSYLHDSTLLTQVRKRYWNNTIYTLIGPIVLALNPFDYTLPNYTVDNMPKYLAEGDTVVRARSVNIPHAWSTAHRSYWLLRSGTGNQSVIVSGESGAGKTETAKIVLKYLAEVSTQQCDQEQRATAEAVNKKVVLTSPILESFGNAKTKRNDNSSRFGKFMKVHFSPSLGSMVGADVEVYLLEKSRVCVHAEGERCYHSFYQLLAGAPEEQRKSMFLVAPDYFQSIAMGKAVKIAGVDDKEDFNAVTDAMNIVGFSSEEQTEVWKVVAGVLHTLTLKFHAVSQDEAGLDPNFPQNEEKTLPAVASLWSVSPDSLVKEFLTTTTTVRGETFVKKLRLAQSEDVKEALCKATYERLFLYLVERINNSVNADPFQVKTDDCWVGLLDIFGFEHFQVNSFEQLCINLANETLQNHYNAIIFTRDMEECHEEGIDTESVLFYDNQPCLDLICGYNFSALTKTAWAAHSKNAATSPQAPGSPQSPPASMKQASLFSLIDEESKLGKGTDLSFLEKAEQRYGGHANFEKPKTSNSTFVIKHYAGEVTYSVEGFRDKNSDTMKESLKQLLHESSLATLSKIFPAETHESRGQLSVSTLYRRQLVALMSELNSTHPHWIRCVKPHKEKRSRMFCGMEVMSQMRSAGVLETVRIRKMSFSMRFLFADFCQHFRIMLLEGGRWANRSSDKDATLEILEKTGVNEPHKAQVGKTKVFLKTEAFYSVAKQHHAMQARLGVVLQAHARARQSAERTRVQQLSVYIRWMQAHARRWQSALVIRQHQMVQYVKWIQAALYYRPATVVMREYELKAREKYLLENFKYLLLLQSTEAKEREGKVEKEEAAARAALRAQWSVIQLQDMERTELISRNELFQLEFIHPWQQLQRFEQLEAEENGARERIILEQRSLVPRLTEAHDELKQTIAEIRKRYLLQLLSRVLTDEEANRQQLLTTEDAEFAFFRGSRAVLCNEEALRRQLALQEALAFDKIVALEEGQYGIVKLEWHERKDRRDKRDVNGMRKEQHELRLALYKDEEDTLMKLLLALEEDFAKAVRTEEKRLVKAERKRHLEEERERAALAKEESDRLEKQRQVAQDLWLKAENERKAELEREQMLQAEIDAHVAEVASSMAYMKQFRGTGGSGSIFASPGLSSNRSSTSIPRGTRGVFSTPSPLISSVSPQQQTSSPTVGTVGSGNSPRTPRHFASSEGRSGGGGQRTPRGPSAPRGGSSQPRLVPGTLALSLVPVDEESASAATRTPRHSPPVVHLKSSSVGALHQLQRVRNPHAQKHFENNLQQREQTRTHQRNAAARAMSPEEKHRYRKELALAQYRKELQRKGVSSSGCDSRKKSSSSASPQHFYDPQSSSSPPQRRSGGSGGLGQRKIASNDPFSPNWTPPDAEHVYLPDGRLVAVQSQTPDEVMVLSEDEA